MSGGPCIRTRTAIGQDTRSAEDFVLNTRSDFLLRDTSPLQGQVSAVFENSFDLLLNNYLVNINSARHALHPLGILTPASLIAEVRTDQPVTLEPDQLRIDSRSFQLQTHFDPPAPPAANELKNIELAPLRKCLEIRVNKSRHSSSLLTGDFDSQPEIISRAGGALVSQPNEKIVDFNRLLDYFGDGEGLTPSFDDICAGLLFADRRLNCNNIKLPGELFKRLKNITTLTSRWQLEFARRGKLSLALERLFNRLVEGKASVKDCISACHCGHTSGADILTGIYLYFKNF